MSQRSVQLDGQALEEEMEKQGLQAKELALKAKLSLSLIYKAIREEPVYRTSQHKIEEALNLPKGTLRGTPGVRTVFYGEPGPAADPKHLLQSLRLFEEAFPAQQRHSREELQLWLEESKISKDLAEPWRELWAVLCDEHDDVRGFMYLTSHTDRKWSFGSYLYIVEDARGSGLDVVLLKASICRLGKSVRGVKGVVFEIEPFNPKVVTAATKRPTTCRTAHQKRHVANFTRFVYFQQKGAFTIVGSDGRTPLPYRQPPLAERRGTDSEREMILMVYPIKSRADEIDVRELVTFIHHVYAASYAEQGLLFIDGYGDHLDKVAEKMLTTVDRGCSLKQLTAPREWLSLLYNEDS